MTRPAGAAEPEKPKRVRREYNRGWADGNASALDACNPIIEQLQRQLAELRSQPPDAGEGLRSCDPREHGGRHAPWCHAALTPKPEEPT